MIGFRTSGKPHAEGVRNRGPAPPRLWDNRPTDTGSGLRRVVNGRPLDGGQLVDQPGRHQQPPQRPCYRRCASESLTGESRSESI